MSSLGLDASPDTTMIAPARLKVGWIAVHAAIVLALLVLLGWAIGYGMQFRGAEAYNRVLPIRYTGDLGNACYYGAVADKGGLFRIYDDMVTGAGPATDRRLDYPPLRIAVVWAWYRHLPSPPRMEHRGQLFRTEWQPTYAQMAPLLWLNTIAEWLTMVGLFLLARHWTTQTHPRSRWRILRPYDGVARGMSAALLFWLSPAVLYAAHYYPQWDVWILPFYTFAILAACKDWWFTAGMLVAVGAMFKGQMMFCGAILPLWAIFGGRFGAAARVLGGFGLAAMAVAAPWMMHGTTLVAWPMTVVLAIAVWWFGQFWRAGFSWHDLIKGIYVPTKRDWWIPLAAGAIGGVLCAWPLVLSDVSYNWIRIGFLYGTEKYPEMATPGAMNLCALLQQRWGWNRIDEPVALFWTTVPLKTLLTGIFATCLVLCGFAASVHARRKDPKLLIAVVLPWILFFILLPQLHSRYLIWGASLAGVLVVLGWEMLGLAAILHGLSWMMVAYFLLHFGRARYWPEAARFVNGAYPDAAWAVMGITVVLLFLAIPKWRRAVDTDPPDSSTAVAGVS